MEGPVDLGEIMAFLRTRLPGDAIQTCGAGNFTVWAHRFAEFTQYGTQVCPRSGSMGYGVAAAVAAKLVHPERIALCFSGDGDFVMSSPEFATAVQYELPIVVLLVNNGMYATIRMHQERQFPGRVIGTTLENPDFPALAQAYGGFGERVERTEDFEGAFERALASGKPALLELPVDPERISPRVRLSELRRPDEPRGDPRQRPRRADLALHRRCPRRRPLFVSGIVAVDAEGALVGGDDVVAQTRQVFENMRAILAAAGCGVEDVAKVTVFLTNVDDRPLINPVRQEVFGSARPASTLVEVSRLVVPGAKVEIEAVALVWGDGARTGTPLKAALAWYGRGAGGGEAPSSGCRSASAQARRGRADPVRDPLHAGHREPALRERHRELADDQLRLGDRRSRRRSWRTCSTQRPWPGWLFIVASGFSLIFGLMRVVNMAHGAFYLLGGYIAYEVQQRMTADTPGFIPGAFVTTWEWLIPMAVAMLCIGGLGFVIQQAFLRWNQGQDLRQALITIALSVIIADQVIAHFPRSGAFQTGGGNLATITWPGWTERRIDLQVAGVEYSLTRLAILALGIIVGVALWTWLHRTRTGMVIRAGVDDRQMTSALGINIQRTFALAFFVGSALAAMGGTVGASQGGVASGQDGLWLLYSLVVVIVGGMGSLLGAAAGSLLVAVG